MLADANTSALAPPAISSRSKPDGPYFGWTRTPVVFSMPPIFRQRAAQTAGGVKKYGVGSCNAHLHARQYNGNRHSEGYSLHPGVRTGGRPMRQKAR